MNEVRGETNKELNLDKPQKSGANIGDGDQGRPSESRPVERAIMNPSKSKPLTHNKQPELLKPEQQPKRRP